MLDNLADHPCINIEKIKGEIELIKSQISAIHECEQEQIRTIKGNNGNVGLVAKMSKLEEVVESLVIIMDGKDGNSGMLFKMTLLIKSMEDIADNRKWFTRQVLGWVITFLMGALVATGFIH